jgi:hypothetical protein
MSARKLLPSVEELRRVFNYDPVSGMIKWRINRLGSTGNRVAKAGTELGLLGSMVIGGLASMTPPTQHTGLLGKCFMARSHLPR